MTRGQTGMITESELNRLLAVASKPMLLPGFEARLARRMALGSPTSIGSNVIAFKLPPRSRVLAPSAAAHLPFAAALVASLVIGIWLGGSGGLPNLFDPFSDTAMLDASGDYTPAALEGLEYNDTDDLS